LTKEQIPLAAALAFIASVLVMTPEAVSAVPLTLGDHAALSRHMSTTVMQVAHRHAYARHYKRYVYTAPRRYNWQYYPYWRPYHYYYWQHYYPYGGPLF
jgi:hypothetical protein